METLVRLLLDHGALLVFAMTLAARAGAPLPAGPMLVIAGALGVAGQVSVPLMVALSLLANLLGDAVWFVGGRRHGYRVMRLLCRVSLSPDTCVRQSEGLFGRWGGVSLVAAKFVPGVSLVAAPMAGALRMPWPAFIAWDLAASAAWTAAYMALGAVFSTQVREVLQVLADAGTKALIALLVVAAAALLRRWLARRRLAAAATVPRIPVAALDAALASSRPPTLLDVRSVLARDAGGMLPGAVGVDLADLHDATAGYDKGAPLVVYCNCPNDVSALKAATMLQAQGFADVRVLAGGHDAWAAAHRAAPGAAPAPVPHDAPGLPAA